MNLKTTIAATVLLVIGSTASASTLYDTVWFGGHQGLQATGEALQFTSAGGVGVDATGHKLKSDGSIGKDYQIGQYWGGLGVTSPDDNDHQIDGKGPNEVAKLSFSQSVTVEKVWFTYVGFNDDFAFTMIDGDDAGSYYSSTDIPGGWFWDSGVGAYYFHNDWTGTMFGFGASGKNDDYKLKGIKFSYHDVAPVPLPAGGLLLLGGIAVMAGLRRRSAKAS